MSKVGNNKESQIIVSPRFAMFYPNRTILDDGKDIEITFTVPNVWKDAPADGIQAVILHLPNGRLRVFSGLDIYAVMQNGEPFGTNDIGPLMRNLGLIKYGMNMPNAEWDDMRQVFRNYRKDYEDRR